jgi:hypothetical protein
VPAIAWAAEPDIQVPIRQPSSLESIFTSAELFMICTFVSSVWAFIWIGSYSEWSHNVPVSLDGETCREASIRNGVQGCVLCRDDYINVGLSCLSSLEEIGPLQVGAKFGSLFYAVLIVCTQLCGATSAMFLIRRTRRLGFLARKELAIVAIALFIDIVRMFLVDIFVIQDLFSGGAYQIFREPIPCDPAARYDEFFGADGTVYCEDFSNITAATRYYIGTSRAAFSSDTGKCTTWTSASPLLDFNTLSETWPFQFWAGGGHPRFSRLGWVVGGEFAFYIFFAVFINEVADIMFILPTSVCGWRFKALAILLELFQLGAICPAAIFTHGECLHHSDPFGVSLRFLRDVAVTFGYCTAVMPFFAIPLAVLGLGIPCVMLFIAGIFVLMIILPLKCISFVTRGVVAATVDKLLALMQQWLRLFVDELLRLPSMDALLPSITFLTFIPLLITGVFLGFFSVVGQASKKDGMQGLLALVFVSDVSFKIIATTCAEVLERMVQVGSRIAAVV